jgi:hypothetical protein
VILLETRFCDNPEKTVPQAHRLLKNRWKLAEKTKRLIGLMGLMGLIGLIGGRLRIEKLWIAKCG